MSRYSGIAPMTPVLKHREAISPLSFNRKRPTKPIELHPTNLPAEMIHNSQFQNQTLRKKPSESAISCPIAIFDL